MGREIERKFRVADKGWQAEATASESIEQGYVMVEGGRVLRVRIVDGRRALLTFKAASESAVVRDEFEYEIPLADGRALMQLAAPRVLHKQRHKVAAGGRQWTVDVFGGRHEGLVLAEIELDAEDEAFARPTWLGDEVTDNPQFSNSALATRAQ